MGSGSMLRTAGRAVGAGVGTVKDAVAVVSGGGRAAVVKPCRAGCSTTLSPPTTVVAAAERGVEHWEHVGGEDDKSVDADEFRLSERAVFGMPPSKEEAEDAISKIQSFVQGTLSQYADQNEHEGVDDLQRSSAAENCAETKTDWIEPELHLRTSSTLQHDGCNKVYSAFRLLQINPSIKRMVVSLSSDKSVWDAVMKNEVVQELKESVCEEAADDDDTEKKDGIPTGIFKRIFSSARAKLSELLEKIMQLMNEICHTEQKDDKNEKSQGFDDLVASSFMISVMVFIIVVITRIHKA